MLGPNHHSHQLAIRTYDERLRHAARIQMLKQARHDGEEPVDRTAHRRITANRLAAVVTALVFSIALAATVAANTPAVGGGSMTLIR